VNQARAASEPLLWLQLLGLSLLPLEALLILLLLAGSDPGRLPALERLLCWALGGLVPALLLWRRPADVWSLLLVQTPARGRRDLQRRLSALQDTVGLRLALALGAALLLVVLWRLDGAAALATALAPLPEAPRLVDLLLTALVLALMLWQWQQAIQSVWLLSRSETVLEATPPLSPAELPQRRLSLGLPLLLPAPLQASHLQASHLQSSPLRGRTGTGTAAPRETEASVAGESGVAIEPEQATEESGGSELDQPVG
jgi:hypothetical protein